jgi:hypothetical protein
MKKMLLSILTLLFSISVGAANNCCTGHGEVAGCDDATGQLMCMDGTDSKTCACPVKDNTQSYDDKLCTPSYVSLVLSQEVVNGKFPMDSNAFTASTTPLLMCGNDQVDVMASYGKIKYLDVAYVLLATLSYNKFTAGSELYHQSGTFNDLMTAISWYKLCADDNIGICQSTLGNIYLFGSKSGNANFQHMEGYSAKLNEFLPNIKQAQKYLALAGNNTEQPNNIYTFIIKTNNNNVAHYLSQKNRIIPTVNYHQMT